MGKNKQLRKRIRGLLGHIAMHEQKVRRELEKAAPNAEAIRGWEREIDIARNPVRKLEERLEK
jgi:hypothetical protein